MNILIKYCILLILMLLVLGYLNDGMAQTNPQKNDSTKKVLAADSLKTGIELTGFEEEIELLEINIEAVIEKPRVAILPRRVEPELSEMEFINRSFETELKKVPEKPMVMDNRLFAPKKIEDLKQKLLANKKKQTRK